MAVQGSLKTITIPELFSLLHQLRKTGVLTLVTSSDERSFVLYKGNIVYAMARDGSRRMGSYLVRLGLLTQEELNSQLARRTAADVYIGQRLVESGQLSREDVHHAVQVQILDILGEAMVWPDGAFHFDDEELPFSIPDGTPVSTHSIILEAARRADERNWTLTIFPSVDTVFLKVESPALSSLDGSAKEIAALCDSQRPLSDLFFLSPCGERETVTCLRELVDRGILKVLQPPPQAAAKLPGQDLQGLPVAPDVPGKLAAILSSDGQKVQRIADVLRVDPTLAAKVLREASARKGEIPRQELSLRQVAASLGSYSLRSLLLPDAVRGIHLSLHRHFWKECWEHSTFCAHASQRLAELTEYPYPEEAFLAGLLHNLGVFILHNASPEKYRKLVEQSHAEGKDIQALEEETFGTSHTKLGGALADRWRFPRNFGPVLRGHHRFDAAANGPLLSIVVAACGLANDSGIQIGHWGDAQQQQKAALKRLGLHPKKALSIVNQVPRVALVPVV